jgi:hypothetical protein
MRVTIERSGGFAGIALRREVDSASLDELERTTLERLVHDAVAVPPSESRAMPDAYQYDVAIDGDSRTLSETDLPAEWQRLIAWVVERKAGS